MFDFCLGWDYGYGVEVRTRGNFNNGEIDEAQDDGKAMKIARAEGYSARDSREV